MAVLSIEEFYQTDYVHSTENGIWGKPRFLDDKFEKKKLLD